MALVDCLECGNKVSEKATSCPKCGAPVGQPPLASSPAVTPGPPPVPAPAAPSPSPSSTAPPGAPLSVPASSGRLLVLSILGIFVGLGGVVSSLALFGLAQSSSPGYGTWTAVVMVVQASLAGILVVAALGMLRRKLWGRDLAILSCGLFLSLLAVDYIVALSGIVVAPDFLKGMPPELATASLIITVLYPVVTIAFLSRKKAKELFR